jgi:hypothetical protein
MNEAMAIVIAAGITAVGGIGAAAISSFKKLRDENRHDHGIVIGKLESMSDAIDGVSDRLDSHIEWHIKK